MQNNNNNIMGKMKQKISRQKGVWGGEESSPPVTIMMM